MQLQAVKSCSMGCPWGEKLKMTLYIICMYCMICIRICKNTYIYILYMFIGNDIYNYEVQ